MLRIKQEKHLVFIRFTVIVSFSPFRFFFVTSFLCSFWAAIL
jgi:hypothetical protein